MKWHEICLCTPAAVLEVLNAWENGVLSVESVQVSASPPSEDRPAATPPRPSLLPKFLLLLISMKFYFWISRRFSQSGTFGGVQFSHEILYPPSTISFLLCQSMFSQSVATRLPNIDNLCNLSPCRVQKITDNIKGKVCSMAVCAVAWLVAHVRMLGLDEREKPQTMIRQLMTPLFGENMLQFYNERYGCTVASLGGWAGAVMVALISSNFKMDRVVFSGLPGIEWQHQHIGDHNIDLGQCFPVRSSGTPRQ